MHPEEIIIYFSRPIMSKILKNIRREHHYCSQQRFCLDEMLLELQLPWPFLLQSFQLWQLTRRTINMYRKVMDLPTDLSILPILNQEASL